jgi:hypothetical protein
MKFPNPAHTLLGVFLLTLLINRIKSALVEILDLLVRRQGKS